MESTELAKQYIVCNIDGSTHQKRFKIHENFTDAAMQAHALAAAHSPQRFMVMEPVGGFMAKEDGTLVELRVAPPANSSEASEK